MTPLAFFLIPLFTVFASDEHTGEFFEVPVFSTTDILEDCDVNYRINGCVTEVAGYTSIVCEDPFRYSTKAENCLTHEWMHVMGLSENELPKTKITFEETLNR